MGIHETRTFRSGNSEAVLLPKDMGFGIGTEVHVERNGDVLTIRAVEDPASIRRQLRALMDDLATIGVPVDGIQPRDRIDFPDRTGL